MTTTLSADIQELFELLLRIPVRSTNPDDTIARSIVISLLLKRLRHKVNHPG